MPNNETIKNHINPQSLLSFWCNKNGMLKAFNKISKKPLDMTTDNVCFIKHFLPQPLEKEFANGPDAEIKSVVGQIVSSNTISDDNKMFISRFLTFQALRDPELDKRITKLMKEGSLPNDRNLLFYIKETSLKNNIDKEIREFFDKTWYLLTFDKPCLVTNEAMITPKLKDKLFPTE